jgi:4-alpha-glucanotransferase
MTLGQPVGEKKRHDNAGHLPDNLVIRVRAPETTPDRIIALTGNQPCLGNWNPNQAPLLSADNFPVWEIRLDVREITFPLEYKFLALESATNRLCYWEEGENRVLRQPPQTDDDSMNDSMDNIMDNDMDDSTDNDTDDSTDNDTDYSMDNGMDNGQIPSVQCPDRNSNNYCIMVDNYRFRTPAPNWKTCGTVMPVFSLRSEQSFGIGDIGDLKKLIDWAKITNQHVIQVLPMNDTTRTHTWKDSYPYSAISIYALHPLYINIPMLGGLNDKKKRASYHKIQQRLNKKETVDYQSVEKYKTAYYRDYFEQEKDEILKNNDLQDFINQNKEWLIPYAVFSYLRDKYQTADFTKWEAYAHYNREKAEMFCRPESEAYNECTFLFFIQYTLHCQMDAIFRYARENRVILKGDLPIGVNRESVEAWTEPACFNKDAQAGAPPDSFSEKGQNWSFPTYNWDSMSGDGFVWWKKRFHHLQQYFDCFRIDHILGFFRIWEIPPDYTEGLCGYFNPALPLHQNEIEQYGILFDGQWLTPRIHIKYLPELFGDKNIHHLSQYLHYCDAEHLELNENCASQRKIIQLFIAKKSRKSQLIKDGLMRIANEVLFIRDPYHPNGYHPRISAGQSYRYRELSDADKRAYDKIYHHFFFERHNEFWKQTALSRLQPLLKSTGMLVCGEDLGMIPATVHEVMEILQLFSLELERMSKETGCEFTDLTKLPYHSVCTTSTHDMNPVRAWWTENREITQRYYNNILHRKGKAPESCPAEIAKQIITNHLNASSMITVIPLQDWLAMDDGLKRTDAGAERINDPANPNQYWCYRMHITLETLLQSTSFNKKTSNMIAASGR